MSKLVFLDTNVFIWAYNRPASNSAKILDLMDEGIISVIVSEKVIEELKKYFNIYYDEAIWFSVFKHIISAGDIIKRQDIIEEIPKWKGKIKEKDLENLVTVKHAGLKYLIALDDHYRDFEEYITPKEFIEYMGLTPSDTEY